MKSAIAVPLMLCCMAAAFGATFLWDASTTAGVTNYTLRGSNALAVIRVDAGTNLTAVVSPAGPGQWKFWATATKDNQESDPSNSVILLVPQPTNGVRTVIVQFSTDMLSFYDLATLRVTNLAPNGFFRLKIL